MRACGSRVASFVRRRLRSLVLVRVLVRWRMRYADAVQASAVLRGALAWAPPHARLPIRRSVGRVLPVDARIA